MPHRRISTADQTTDNQVQEIAARGFAVNGQRIVTQTVSGSVADMERKGFLALLNKLEFGDVLVVTKLDRLGRNPMEVRSIGPDKRKTPFSPVPIKVLLSWADSPHIPSIHLGFRGFAGLTFHTVIFYLFIQTEFSENVAYTKFRTPV